MTKIQDPDLRALLRELASDPRAKLLRVRRAPIELKRAGRVSSRAALLTAAERELLDAYRAEVAELLKDAARLSLLEDPVTKGVLHRSLTVDRDLDVPSREVLARRTSRMEGLGAGGERCRDALGLLRDCVTSPAAEAKVATRLACAAVRLTEDPAARALAAIALYFEGRWAEAQDALRMVLGDRPDALLRSIVLEFLGVILWARGSCEGALRSYRGAFLAHEERIAPLVAWFAAAVRLGDSHEVLASANELDAMADSEHPMLSAFPRVDPRASCRLVAPRDSLVRLMPGLGPIASKVSHALLAS